MDREKRECCCFTGHRPERFAFRYYEGDPLCVKIKQALYDQAERLYVEGVRRYWFGGALGVDIWAAEAVLKLKQRRPEIELCCAIPFPGFDVAWRPKSRDRLARALAACEETDTICGAYFPDAYKRRNYFMVDRCAYAVAVFDQDKSRRSGTLQTVNYAKKQKLNITYIHPDTGEVL